MHGPGWTWLFLRFTPRLGSHLSLNGLSGSRGALLSTVAVQPKGRGTTQDASSAAYVGRLLYRIWNLQLFPAASPSILVSLVKDLAFMCRARDPAAQRRQHAQRTACAKLGRATAVCVHLLQPHQVLSCLTSFPHFSLPPPPELIRLLLSRLTKDECHHFRQLPAEKIALIAWALGRFPSKAGQKELHSLLKVAAPSFHDLAPHHASLLFLSLLRLQYSDQTILGSLSECTQRQTHLLRHRTVACLMQALAVSRYSNPQLLQALLSRARSAVSCCNSSQLSMMAWALAVLELRDQQPLMLDILAASRKILARFSTRDLANLIWAASALQATDIRLLQQLSRHAQPLMRKCNAADVSTIMSALAQLNYSDTFTTSCAAQRFCDLLTQQAKSQSQRSAVHADLQDRMIRVPGNGAGSVPISIRSCSSMLWALARLRHHHPQLLKLATAQVAAQFSVITPTELMQVCWACATLSYYSPQLVKCLDNCWPSLAPNLTPEQMIHVAWSCSVMQYYNRDFYRALFDSLREQDGKKLAMASLCQLFQVYIILLSAFRLSARQGFRPPSLPPSLFQRAQWEWISQNKSVVSAVQREMYQTLMKSKFQPVLELATTDGLFNIDIGLQHAGLKLAIEVDGPTHFTSNGPPFRPLGPTLSRWQCLEDRGWHVVSIRVQDWSQLHTNKQKEQFLLAAITAAVQAASQNKQQELLTGRDGMGYRRDERLGAGSRTWTARDLIKLME